MQSPVPITPSRALTLYEAEHELLQLMDQEEEVVSPEEEAEIQARLSEQLQYTIDKRESFGKFLLWLDQQQENSKHEIERLRKRAQRMHNLSERLRRYAVVAIRALGPDQKGDFRKLAGRTVMLFLRALPVSVEIRDASQVPHEFKRVTVQLPAERWVQLVADNPVLAGTEVKAVDISKEEVRRALQSGREVPGADLRLPGHDHTLVVK